MDDPPVPDLPPEPDVKPPLRRLTPRLLFEIALTSFVNQHKRIQGRLGSDESQEFRKNVERLRVYHELTWPDDPDDKPLS